MYSILHRKNETNKNVLRTDSFCASMCRFMCRSSTFNINCFALIVLIIAYLHFVWLTFLTSFVYQYTCRNISPKISRNSEVFVSEFKNILKKCLLGNGNSWWIMNTSLWILSQQLLMSQWLNIQIVQSLAHLIFNFSVIFMFCELIISRVD